MNFLDLHQAIAKHNPEFMDVLSDCLDELTSLPEWFVTMDLDDPDLSDRKATAYFEIVAAIQNAIEHDPGVPYRFTSQEMDMVAAMLLPGLNLTPLNAMALEAAVQTLMRNSNKTLEEVYSAKSIIVDSSAPMDVPQSVYSFDALELGDAMARLDKQIAAGEKQDMPLTENVEGAKIYP